jgi:hypothetical protein
MASVVGMALRRGDTHCTGIRPRPATKRAFETTIGMRKIDIAAIEAARRG